MKINYVKVIDCLLEMKKFPDKCVDVIITDPPYGIGESTHRASSRSKLAKTKDYGSFEWDRKISKDYFNEMLRVSKNQIIFGGNYYANWLPPSSCWIVWDKDNGSSNFADCELAWTSFNSAVRKFKWRWNGMIQEDMKNKEVRVHPTQKPLPLMKWLVSNYSKENDVVLDPFMGSGSTLVAAKHLNRRFIGFDINKQYVSNALERLQQEILL